MSEANEPGGAAGGLSLSTAKLERMVLEAGATLYADTLCINGKDAHDFMERFAKIVADEERKVCADKIKEYEASGWHGSSGYHSGLLCAERLLRSNVEIRGAERSEGSPKLALGRPG